MNLRQLGYGLMTVILASGCSSIVKKPDIGQVKSVAIISVYASDDVREEKNRGRVKGWASDLKTKVSNNILDTYKKGFQDLGWQIMPADKLLSSQGYIDTFRPQIKTENETLKKLNAFATKMADLGEKFAYFTPEGMHPIELSSSQMNSYSYANGKRVDVRAQLGEYAKLLGVDAVIVVQMDYCYGGSTFSSLGGTGKGYMHATSSVRAVDKNGKLVINMGDLGKCVETENRGTSDQGYAMLGGNLVVGIADQETAYSMFSQSTGKNAKLTLDLIQKAMK